MTPFWPRNKKSNTRDAQDSDPFMAKKHEDYYQSCPRFGPLFGQETRKELAVIKLASHAKDSD